MEGRDFRLENLRKANKKVSTVKSVTTSMWSALAVAHMKTQMYILLSSVLSLMYRATVKSTPVTVIGRDSVTQIFGKGGGSGALFGLPNSFVYVKQRHNSFLMY